MSALDHLPADIADEIRAGVKKPMRDDLKAIPQAEEAGWTVRFRNDNWHNGATFERDGVHIWVASPKSSSLLMWRRAILDPDTNSFHSFSWCKTLAEALESQDLSNENGAPPPQASENQGDGPSIF